ncbi:MAG TPA: hypothetical protein VFS11_03020 [Gemmatimonadales bacterium]|nr:hypothetical protein [Gemmatimonadales bacterium]
MTTISHTPLRTVATAFCRSAVVWGITVCIIYGPTGCTLGAAMLVLLAGLPAVALSTWLAVWAAAKRGRRRCQPAGYVCARMAGALSGAVVPVLALSLIPTAPNVVAAAVRLLLGTTVLLTPVWIWLGSELGMFLLATAPARLSRPSGVRRELTPSGQFAQTWA